MKLINNSKIKAGTSLFCAGLLVLSGCKKAWLDINTNPNFKSNVALKEAMGYILGMGFAFKAKPEAFASSSCANKAVN